MKFRISLSKRGLSTAVSSAILLTGVAVMGIMLVSWSNANLARNQQDLDSSFSDNLNRINEELLLGNIWFGNTPSNNINITMSNVGTVGLNVTEIEIKDYSTGSTKKLFSYSNTGLLPRGEFSVNETFAWVSDTSYDVLITTERGSIFRTQVSAP